MIINLKICRVLMARGDFVPTMCAAFCSRERATCPNWQGWLEESPEVEVNYLENPNHERDRKE